MDLLVLSSLVTTVVASLAMLEYSESSNSSEVGSVQVSIGSLVVRLGSVKVVMMTYCHGLMFSFMDCSTRFHHCISILVCQSFAGVNFRIGS